jgi:hypothetical protein
MRQTRPLFVLVAAAMTALFAGTAFASGPPIVKEVSHPVDEAETFVSVDPCTGTPAEISLLQSGVVHFMFFANGRAQMTETLRGTFSFRAVDSLGNPVGDSYATGRFVSEDSVNGVFDPATFEPIGRAVITDTLNGRGTRTDGTTFHFHNNEHILFVGTPPSPSLEFFKAHCN